MTTESNVTLNEKARVNLPVIAISSGAVAVVLATAGAVGTYLGLRNQITTIGATVSAIEKEIGKIADRVETGPTRREFELLLERVRLVESKVRGE